MDTQERNRQIHEESKAALRRDYEPFHLPGSPVAPELRLANAAEYAAFQLGQMNRKLDLLIASLTSKT